jgi:hypothetical protein
VIGLLSASKTAALEYQLYLFTVQFPFIEAQADRSMKASRGIGGGF